MNGLLEWLLDLERVRLDQGSPALELDHPPPAWVMLAGFVAIVVLVGLVYRYERGGPWLRMGMATLRASVLLLVLGLLARPSLVLRRERVDPSVVAVVVDSSASMAEKDVRRGDAESDRYAAAMSILLDPPTDASASPAGGMELLRKRHRVELWTFADAARRVAWSADVAALDALRRTTAPDGGQTDAAAALEQVYDRTQGARVAGVILLSDGRQTRTSAADRFIAAARERQAPVYAVPIGSPLRKLDIEVGPVQADDDVFLKDIVSVQARLLLTAAGAASEIPVRLVDTATGVVLDERPARFRAGDSPTENQSGPGETAEPSDESSREAWADVELRFRPTAAGRLALRVEAQPLPDETETANNAVDVIVRVHDEKLRLLYVEGPPRYEYRFLKNALLREPTVASSCLLLDATASFVQEGTDPIRAFPVSPGELSNYDVVMLGDVDVRGDWLSPSQMAMLVDFVGQRGGGLAFLAGERAMPQRLAGTPLERLLPVRIDRAAPPPGGGPITRAFVLSPTIEGRRHPLLRLEVDPAENDATWAAMPGLYWYARVLGVKPGAEVLAVHPNESTAEGPMPLLAAGRFGNGRTLFVGSDDLWRWRREQGEAFHEGFWLNALRYLAGQARWKASRLWRLEADRRVVDAAHAATFRLTARDPEAAAGLSEVSLRVDNAAGEPVARVKLERRAADRPEFEGVLHPARAGVFTATAEIPGAAPGDEPPSRTITVRPFDPERRDTRADPAFLRRLTEQTGGRSVSPAEFATLCEEIPDRSVHLSDDLTEPLWDTRLALAAMILLLSAEWIVRKFKGLP